MYNDMFSDLYGYQGFAGAIVLFVLMLLVIFLISIILITVAKYKVYKKAGYQGWEALIPFYSSWILVKIASVEWWFVLVINAAFFLGKSAAPISGLITLTGLYFVNYNIAKKFSKDAVIYGAGLTILPIIFYPLLAFGKDSNYNSEVLVSAFGPVSETTAKEFVSNNSKKVPEKFCKKCGSKLEDSKFCSNCGEKNTK